MFWFCVREASAWNPYAADINNNILHDVFSLATHEVLYVSFVVGFSRKCDKAINCDVPEDFWEQSERHSFCYYCTQWKVSMEFLVDYLPKADRAYSV